MSPSAAVRIVTYLFAEESPPAAQFTGGHGPGWYPSPQQPGQMQWWNGAQWTPSFAPQQSE
ncbi:DUF2510 domain-containing protein [Amycolatopsis panacis]|uniref:DUF2510 domain-containing protein n=1 Tax=Amycolatopsis panacis TaxID=2340917 RepID=A0A419HQN3_9PSEU|nr:DUF2510 domain-containing protein [Amycolatopsis panacis]RJQ78707.1 DUF2510 domain-containing protein [Amycolatopsis panacis]